VLSLLGYARLQIFPDIAKGGGCSAWGLFEASVPVSCSCLDCTDFRMADYSVLLDDLMLHFDLTLYLDFVYTSSLPDGLQH
jgi:hypothetical protein